jgi:hypothetical protein
VFSYTFWHKILTTFNFNNILAYRDPHPVFPITFGLRTCEFALFFSLPPRPRPQLVTHFDIRVDPRLGNVREQRVNHQLGRKKGVRCFPHLAEWGIMHGLKKFDEIRRTHSVPEMVQPRPGFAKRGPGARGFLGIKAIRG